MSELRKRCFDLWDKMPTTAKCYCSDIDFNNWPNDVRKACTVCRRVDDIEAFAKEQQIKGMEAVRDLTHTHHAPYHWYFEWLRKKIDAEIQQLKEGG